MSKRRFLIAGNWKMNSSQDMTAELIAGVAERLNSSAHASDAIDVLVCPPSVFLAAAQLASKGTQLAIGSQNVSPFDSGAYTGETSLAMLAEFGCTYALVGHSERRELFAETNSDIAEKFAACISSESNIVPVLCIGETLEQRQTGATESVIAAQLDAVISLSGIAGFDKAVIAYEPVWAIGTGETASPEQAQQVHQFIRNKLATLDAVIANKVRILYGGSMKPSNAQELLAQPDIDGGLIGGAALQVDSFAGICDAALDLVG
ncbi:MAG: triosephosphate isomerase [Arenicella sp.]|jgi:triosephosphate isomerase